MQALGLQIEDQLFEMIESMVCQFYGFLKKLMSVTFDMVIGAGRNCLKLLKFNQPKTSYMKNVLEAKQEIPGADQHGWSVTGNLCSSLDVQ